MTRDAENRLLREKGLAFFGTITASLSHEINNVVAIINELSGLFDDLLAGAAAGRPIDDGRLATLSLKIGTQVKKGEEIIKRLNRFAHSVDDPVKSFDLRELLNEINALAQRFAFLRGVRLETDFPAESITLKSDPFGLQQAVFACIKRALADSRKNDTVTLSFEKNGTGARIVTAGTVSAEATDTDTQFDFLSILMRELGGTADVVAAEGGRRSFVLTVPESMPTGGGETNAKATE
jgi:signal transduction histidine kinase